MIAVNWADDNKTLLMWRLEQRWSRIDFLTACHKSQKMVLGVQHKVDIFFDISVSKIYPSNIIYLALTGMRMHTPNTGKIVVMGKSQLWSRLYQYMTRVYSADTLPVHFVKSPYEARNHLPIPHPYANTACNLAYSG